MDRLFLPLSYVFFPLARFRNSESLANQPSVAYALNSWEIFKKAGCKQSSVLVVAYASVAGKVLDLYKMF